MPTVPLLGLSPMDGVTDAAMRYITAKYGHPDLITTEFVNVEGWHHASQRLAHELDFDPIEQPVIAQIYGVTPEYFADLTRDIVERGFAGVEINFGCPAKSVVHSGAGASMIKTPALAGQIIQAVQAAAGDLPVSIKTRLGYDHNVAAQWIPFLLQFHPARLTVHGRTLKQGYTGHADWAAIAACVHYRDQISPSTLLFGNGDVRSLAQASERAAQTGVDGVLIGRAAIGNPWVFTSQTPDLATRARTALEHAQVFERLNRQRDKYSFAPMRKHLAAYVGGFAGARDLRARLVLTNSSLEVADLVQPFLASQS
ncbi:tRNA-dihydrouridine synthase [bacterium]|nr:tRNA-dihydrouridine synthase [bacterium]